MSFGHAITELNNRTRSKTCSSHILLLSYYIACFKCDYLVEIGRVSANMGATRLGVESPLFNCEISYEPKSPYLTPATGKKLSEGDAMKIGSFLFNATEAPSDKWIECKDESAILTNDGTYDDILDVTFQYTSIYGTDNLIDIPIFDGTETSPTLNSILCIEDDIIYIFQTRSNNSVFKYYIKVVGKQHQLVVVSQSDSTVGIRFSNYVTTSKRKAYFMVYVTSSNISSSLYKYCYRYEFDMNTKELNRLPTDGDNQFLNSSCIMCLIDDTPFGIGFYTYNGYRAYRISFDNSSMKQTDINFSGDATLYNMPTNTISGVANYLGFLCARDTYTLYLNMSSKVIALKTSTDANMEIQYLSNASFVSQDDKNFYANAETKMLIDSTYHNSIYNDPKRNILIFPTSVGKTPMNAYTLTYVYKDSDVVTKDIVLSIYSSNIPESFGASWLDCFISESDKENIFYISLTTNTSFMYFGIFDVEKGFGSLIYYGISSGNKSARISCPWKNLTYYIPKGSDRYTYFTKPARNFLKIAKIAPTIKQWLKIRD